MVDEGNTERGIDAIRAWRERTASHYEYTTEVFGAEQTTEHEYVLTGRLTGNFPGGIADLTWRFSLEGDLISHLHID